MRADLVYMDLGMSSMQVDNRERGFAYAYDAPLDMRMDPAQELTAAEIVNTWERRRLAALLRDYGEERFADRIAGEIVRRRGRDELTTTFELNDAITAAIPAPARFAGGHPAKRTFQAIRIAVNGELAQLDEALPLAWDVLRVGGRLAALSFHSLEDRRVKRFLADRTRGCICPPDLPVCVCGNTPEAELVHRRSVVPTPGRGRGQPPFEVGSPAGRPQAHEEECAHDARPHAASPDQRPLRTLRGTAPGLRPGRAAARRRARGPGRRCRARDAPGLRALRPLPDHRVVDRAAAQPRLCIC